MWRIINVMQRPQEVISLRHFNSTGVNALIQSQNENYFIVKKVTCQVFLGTAQSFRWYSESNQTDHQYKINDIFSFYRKFVCVTFQSERLMISTIFKSHVKIFIS